MNAAELDDRNSGITGIGQHIKLFPCPTKIHLANHDGLGEQ